MIKQFWLLRHMNYCLNPSIARHIFKEADGQIHFHFKEHSEYKPIHCCSMGINWGVLPFPSEYNSSHMIEHHRLIGPASILNIHNLQNWKDYRLKNSSVRGVKSMIVEHLNIKIKDLKEDIAKNR